MRTRMINDKDNAHQDTKLFDKLQKKLKKMENLQQEKERILAKELAQVITVAGGTGN